MQGGGSDEDSVKIAGSDDCVCVIVACELNKTTQENAMFFANSGG